MLMPKNQVQDGKAAVCTEYDIGFSLTSSSIS